MVKPLFDTKTLSLAELLGNSKTYKVPRFQRSYSWTETNWEDLWLDIKALKDNEESVHYLGPIVLQTEDNKIFTIIDGQQRIVTLSIIILVLTKLLKEFADAGKDSNKNEERKEIYLNSYIGFKDPKALTYQSKLTLNDTDKDLYNSYLVQLKKPLNISKLPDSNQLMIKAFDYYYNQIKELSLQSGEEIVDLMELIVNRLFFIQISVDDAISAYTVFETLNARGVELTTTDLLKNYLFSLLDNNIDIDNIQPRWDKIVNTVSYRSFPTFLRYYLNSQQTLIRSERLYKEIRNNVRDKNDVIKIIDNLEKYADVYIAFNDPENELWKSFNNSSDIERILKELKLYDVQQYKSLLLAVFFNLKDYFVDVLRIVRGITFRYNIIGKLNPNELERVYNKTAIKISKKEIVTPQAIQKELSSVYIDDEAFKNIFSTKVFDTRKTKEKKLARYVLLSIENQRYNKDYHLFDSDATIEHIFPENYMGNENRLDENFIYRLGNLTLIEASLNRECGNKSFEEKIPIYQKSQYDMTKSLADFQEWDEDAIRARQNDFGRIATSIWRLPF